MYSKDFITLLSNTLYNEAETAISYKATHCVIGSKGIGGITLHCAIIGPYYESL